MRPRSKLHDSRYGEVFPSPIDPSSRFRAWHKVSHGNRAVLLSVYTSSLFPACVREECACTFISPASKESSPSASTHFLHSNARASKLARCDFHSLHFIFVFFFSPRLCLSSPDLFLLQFHGVSMPPFVLVIRNINWYTRISDCFHRRFKSVISL